MNTTRNRPRIHSPCVADHYTRGACRIAEVFDPVAQTGCLIEVRRTDDGVLRISVYRIDKGVEVRVSEPEGGGE